MKYEIEVDTSNNGHLCFGFVDKKTTKKMIEENHYSKSWYHMFGKINIGVFRDDILLGVASFGSMKVPNSYKSISEELEKDQIVELNRLWIDDLLKKNAESLLISKAIKIIKKYYPEIRVIQSFADGRLGCGTIYKASNFKYYGFHETEFFEDKHNGRSFHEMVFHTSSRPLVITRNLEMLDGRFEKFKTRTYRYLFLIDKEINIKLKEQEYPQEKKFKKYISWKVDIEQVNRWIKNCLRYQFEKLGKEKFSFSFNSNQFVYTKEMYEKNLHPKKVLKTQPTISSLFIT